jgi:hypothetical protein
MISNSVLIYSRTMLRKFIFRTLHTFCQKLHAIVLSTLLFGKSQMPTEAKAQDMIGALVVNTGTGDMDDGVVS